VIPLIYIRYALEEYAVGEFVNDDGSSRGYNDTSASGFGKMPSAKFLLSDFFKLQGEVVTDSIPIRYHYIPCNSTREYERFYILDSATSFDTPSETLPSDIDLFDLTVSETVDYLKTTINSTFIYGYLNNWNKSWIQIQNAYKQFHEISTTLNLRNVVMYRDYNSDAVFTKRDITRNGTTGAVISDVTNPTFTELVGRDLEVNNNSIVVNETIYENNRTFDMITDRATNYENSKLYWDLSLIGVGIDSYTLYNYLYHDVIINNEYNHIAPDPRDYMDITASGDYSTFVSGNSNVLPKRQVSEIKIMTLQQILEALNTPSNQYT